MQRESNFFTVNFLLFFYIFFTFTDEMIRKFIGPSGIYVTLVKDFCLFALYTIFLNRTNILKRVRFSICFIFFYVLCSAIVIFIYTFEPTLFFVSIKVFGVFCIAVVIGSGLAYRPKLRSAFFNWFILGMVLASVLAVLQEYARNILPAALQQNNFIDQHSLASGAYVEGPFGSPQTFSIFSFVALLMLYSNLHSLRLSAFMIYLLSCLFIHSLYVSRIRFTILFFILILFTVGVKYIFGSRNSKAPLGYLLSFISFIYIFLNVNHNLVDLNFFIASLTSDSIFLRLTVAFQVQLEGIGWFFGFGVGTTGRLAEFLPSNFKTPFAQDSGISQLLTQFGIFGCVAFFFLFFSIFQSAFRGVAIYVRGGDCVSNYLFLCFVNMYLFSFFLLKQMSVMQNGASGALLGLFAGMLLAPVWRRWGR